MYSKNYDIYDALYTYAIITMLNTTLPLFLCSFSSNTTTIFRFFGAEQAIREMLAHCRDLQNNWRLVDDIYKIDDKPISSNV
ncbi:hypothetical protein V1477_006605 [Vespula maculifrons]|uniref:Uncharacterized protein n=2 Tax=Vespula TaxID=7451 RepID=A0ABD2B959_VESSQ